MSGSSAAMIGEGTDVDHFATVGVGFALEDLFDDFLAQCGCLVEDVVGVA